MNDYAYDIYVIKTSGVPIFAGCTMTEYCQAHNDEHMMHSGLFMAIYALSKESFIDSTIRTIMFDKVQINFKFNIQKKFFIALIHSSKVESTSIITQLNHVHKVFTEKYSGWLDKAESPTRLFEQFKSELKEYGIVPNLGSMLSVQMGFKDVISKNLKNLQ
jgi:hypothetical protein